MRRRIGKILVILLAVAYLVIAIVFWHSHRDMTDEIARFDVRLTAALAVGAYLIWIVFIRK